MNHTETVMRHAADNIRILAVSMVEKAKSGHPGGAMGGADFINVLYSEFLIHDPKNPSWECRDRFFLDPGHMSPMLYAQLALTGKFSLDDLKQFRQWGSPTPGHPEYNVERGIENTSGPLGQGHTYAVGAAIAAKFLAATTGNPSFAKETIYAYISDGGIQEEISQGAGRMAGHLGLDNLIMFYDANDIQLSTKTSVVISEDTAAKYRAWNWHVIEIDGNDCDSIRQALKEAKEEKERPTLIIGHCVMGKGCRRADNSSYERDCGTHGAPLGKEAYINTVKNLGGDPENPFVIYDDVKALYEERTAELCKIVAERKKEEAESAKARVAEIKEASKALQLEMDKAAEDLQTLLYTIPNVPYESVPEGNGAEDNVVEKMGGMETELPKDALPHWELAKKYDLIDFDLGVKITGAGFPVYKGKGARLQRALINFFLDEARAAGYEEIMPPTVVNAASGYGTGQLPDKEGQMYHCNLDDLYLIPTAEVPVTNIYRDVILDEKQLAGTNEVRIHKNPDVTHSALLTALAEQTEIISFVEEIPSMNDIFINTVSGTNNQPS